MIQEAIEEDRTAREQPFRLIAEHATDAMVTIDTQGLIRFVNPATERIFGYSREELIGQELTMLMPDHACELHRTGVAGYVETGRRHIDWEVVRLQGRHKDGHMIGLAFSIAEYLLNGERMFTGIIRDITKWSQTMEDLRQAKEDAETNEHELAETNKAKDRFLAMVSHELRSPLTPILTSVEALREDVRDDRVSESTRTRLPFEVAANGASTVDNHGHWLEIIQRSVALEARLIDDLLDLTRISNGKFQLQREIVDLHDLLRQVVLDCRLEMIARKLRIEAHFEAPNHSVEGDPVRLKQIFWNLLKNAMKFTSEGGYITVWTSNLDGRISISVRDTGIGIEPTLLGRIFEAFEQGNESPGYLGGLGLGLTICKNLVEVHGGTIRAASEGKRMGSTFTVELTTTTATDPSSTAENGSSRFVTSPSPEIENAEDMQGRVTANPHEASTISEHKPKILLVDDQADSNKVVRALLERRGYHVQTATTATEAIGAVNDGMNNDAPFELIISDIGLPDESGLEMLPKLRKIRNVPAIALSGFGSEEDVHQSLNAGFQEHITKPFNFEELHSSIARLLRQ